MAAVVAGVDERNAVREKLEAERQSKMKREREEREKILNEVDKDERDQKRAEAKAQKAEMLKQKTQHLVPDPLLPGQQKVLEIYHGNVVQIGVAGLIFLNFFISAAAAQIGPANCTDTCDLVFTVFEWFFNILFGIELLVNLYAHWFRPFWTSGWNIFDVLIVAISWMSMLAKNSSISVLRLFRAFRAFRLFKRIEEVRIIIVGVARSLPGVSYAFMLLLIIIGIWAIMGVSFFRHDFPLFFGNFVLAVLTLFQVMTFDSWVSQITRPICLYYNSWGAPLYFLSYILIAGIIMTNVVVAILLDKFMAATSELEAAKLKDASAELGEEEPEEEALEPKEESQKYWGDIQTNFGDRLEKLDFICREPLPETLAAKQKALEEEAQQAELDKQARRAADKLPGQSWLKECYDSPPPTIIIAGAIVLNFFVSAVNAQMLPAEDDPASNVFFAFEVIFNVLFGVELIVNMYANGRSFWKDNWNIFDFFIVLISWASMLGLLQGGISVLRLFRAFRVFRLFKRVKALRQIIAGIIKSLPGVFNAFVILFLVMGIWSIMGCNFFSDKFEAEFGNFSKAMLSMFQIMSYDSWSSGITRPVSLAYSDTPIPPIFFLTYVFISAIIMSNVVLAILLDKFLAASAEFNKAEAGDEGTPIAEIIDGFDDSMELQKQHIDDFKKDVMKKLEALDSLVQGPLRDVIEAQKDQTLGLQRSSFSRKATGLLAKLGLGGEKKKTSRVAPS
eukprot:gnl/MRDRNA2_/MRDRNA2_53118_c0_seq1.p1 gnl/MRDRNA2_/MRDRNA2_53118_c0~~gnl/MRDRNA2_/MRDRNA2_53118_c0_seq1.p1  ORF type:complete len:732 (-),score=173.37 gnl/MRDRNA2_/MRDRNA2_53118_c0_seq1:130-2325(-)